MGEKFYFEGLIHLGKKTKPRSFPLKELLVIRNPPFKRDYDTNVGGNFKKPPFSMLEQQKPRAFPLSQKIWKGKIPFSGGHFWGYLDREIFGDFFFDLTPKKGLKPLGIKTEVVEIEGEAEKGGGTVPPFWVFFISVYFFEFFPSIFKESKTLSHQKFMGAL